MVTKIEIRRATADDLNSVTLLNQKLFQFDAKFHQTLDHGFPLSAVGQQYFLSRVSGHSGVGFIAEINGIIVGYLVGAILEAPAYRSFKKLGELENMFVEVEARGKGVGRQLVSKFFDWCKQEGVSNIRVVATAQNETALEFYRRLGFADSTVTLEHKF